MNFKSYFKETADPEKIPSGLKCQHCGKQLDSKDLQTYKWMNQSTGKLCHNCQNNLNVKINKILGNKKHIESSIKRNTPGDGNPAIDIRVWGNREQMF